MKSKSPEKWLNGMYPGALVVLIITTLLAACSNPTPAPPVATETPTPEPATATPTLTLTPAPTVTRTITPSPTPFVTPPAAGQAGIIPILMYHHLTDLPANASELELTWTVAPKNFEAQMDWLVAHGFHTISMAQLVGYLKRGQPLPAKPIIISFDDGWEDDYSVAFPSLKKRNLIGTFFVYIHALNAKQFISWAQVEEMSAAGMDFQSHTVTHPHLRQLAAEAAAKEIGDSKTILEQRLGKPVVALAYPSGEYNQAIIDQLKRAGYESAVTIDAGYKQKPEELFTLHRIRVSYKDTLEDVAKRLP